MRLTSTPGQPQLETPPWGFRASTWEQTSGCKMQVRGFRGTGVTQCFWMGLPGDTVQKKEGLSPWRCSEKLQIQGGTGTSAEWAGIEPRNSQKTHWLLEKNRAVKQAHSVGPGRGKETESGTGVPECAEVPIMHDYSSRREDPLVWGHKAHCLHHLTLPLRTGWSDTHSRAGSAQPKGQSGLSRCFHSTDSSAHSHDPPQAPA